MDSRRTFIGRVASGLAGTLAAPASVLGASDKIRLGVIGAGERGMHLAREAAACPNTEVTAAADIYARRREESGFTAYADYRALLEDKSIDAVLIATPQHLHAAPFCDALDAGKHVYVEKTMALTVGQAKRMREAVRRAGRRTVQVGHQSCSSGHVADAAHMLTGLGRITAIRAHMYRNTPHGKPQWSRLVYPDMTPESLDWSAFLGEAPAVPFDAQRFTNWRYFWDYSGGNFHENLSQQAAFWYKVLGLQIPTAVTATGGVYLWKDGREVPDTMDVSMEQPEELLFTWGSGFGNNHYGVVEDVLGTDGTISRGQQIRYTPQKVNRRDAPEMVGQRRAPAGAHMQNFLDSIRSGRETSCPFDLGYRVSILSAMAVESYRQRRTVRWDPVAEEIV